LKLVKIMRIISATMLLYSMYLILKYSPEDIWNLSYTYAWFSFLRSSIIFFLYLFLLYLSFFSFFFVYIFTQEIPNTFYVGQLLFQGYFQKILNAPTLETSIDIKTILKPAYVFSVQIIVVFMILSFILFLFRCDYSNAYKVTLFEGSLLFLYKLGEFLKFINPLWEEHSLLTMSIWSFITNPLIHNLLAVYIAFDLALQTSYVRSVFSLQIRKGSKLEEQIEESQTREEAPVSSLSMFMAKRFLTSDVIQYLREIVEKRFSRKRKELTKGIDSTRLKIFLENLYQMDPEAKSSLEAEVTFPSERKTLISIALSTLYRLLALIVLSYIAIHPQLIFSFLGAPEPIIRSLELLQPEAILLILLPLLLTTVLIGLLLPTRKD